MSSTANTKVRLVTNLGDDDRFRFGLGEEAAMDGDWVHVKKEHADEMIKNCWAVDQTTGEAEDKKVAAEAAKVADFNDNPHAKPLKDLKTK